MMRNAFFIGIFLLLAACGGPSDAEIDANNAIINTYNAYSNATTTLVDQHNIILTEVRNGMGSDAAYRTAVGKYLVFAKEHKGNFTTFSTFVRQNDAFLKQREIDTDFLQSQLQSTIDTMERNSKDFNEYLVNSRDKPTGTAVESSSLHSRFRTVPLYR